MENNKNQEFDFASDSYEEGPKVKGLLGMRLKNNLSMITGMSKKVISNLVTNLFLPGETWKTKNDMAPLHGGGGDHPDTGLGNSLPIYLQNTGSESTLADLTKLSYKEIYAIYKISDPHIRKDWQAISFVDDLTSGLDARVFVNKQTREINISFEGSHGFTKLLAGNILDGELLKDLKKYSDNFTRHATEDEYNILFKKWHNILGKDGLSDLQIFSNKIPDQFYAGYAWFTKIEKQLASGGYGDYKQVITGHSLGGGLAQLVSAQYQLDTGKEIATVAFQGPGMLPQLEQLAGRKLKSEDFSQIVNFVTEGDPVGEFYNNQHVGLTVSMPYTLSRNDEYWALKYRFGMDLFQKVAGIEDIRVDRHEIGQQIDIFSGTDFSYPENKVILTAQDDSYTGILGKEELIMGYGGNDIIFGGKANDYICGGNDNDILHGGAGDDFIVGDAGDDQLFGDAGSDLLYGGAGNDYLHGGAGDDRLFGGGGNDTLVWSGGNDLLYGQQGDDSYLIGGVSEDGTKVSGKVILKFDREESGHDLVKFDLTAMDTKNSYVTFLMGDHILPSDFSMQQDGKNLLIHYDKNSSILMENWAEVSSGFGNNVSFKFGCTPSAVELKLSNI